MLYEAVIHKGTYSILKKKRRDLREIKKEFWDQYEAELNKIHKHTLGVSIASELTANVCTVVIAALAF